MRAVALLVIAAVTLVAPLGLALSKTAPAPKPAARPVATAPLAPSASGEAAFPNCPAPAVNGINVRAVAGEGGTRLGVFVIVQNVGNRTFLPRRDAARLHIRHGGETLGTFAVERLGAGEVKFFSVETTVPTGAGPQDIQAALDFADGVRTGAVSGTADCQTSDNLVKRRGESIRMAVARP